MHRVTPRAASAPHRAGEAAQTMAEYAMVVSIITVAILLVLVTIGDSAGGLIDRVTSILS